MSEEELKEVENYNGWNIGSLWEMSSYVEGSVPEVGYGRSALWNETITSVTISPRDYGHW